jgi:hypothetical protein
MLEIKTLALELAQRARASLIQPQEAKFLTQISGTPASRRAASLEGPA